MKVTLRTPHAHEIEVLEALCLRSKAYWGYDEDFIARCRPFLRVSPELIELGYVRIAEYGGAIAGIAQVSVEGSAELELMFVDPPMMGFGIGEALFRWAAETVRQAGARKLYILSDPGARGFYERMGAVHIGEERSEAAPGRTLPHLVLTLSG